MTYIKDQESRLVDDPVTTLAQKPYTFHGHQFLPRSILKEATKLAMKKLKKFLKKNKTGNAHLKIP
jgi:hypothetical protein